VCLSCKVEKIRKVEEIPLDPGVCSTTIKYPTGGMIASRRCDGILVLQGFKEIKK